MSPTSDNRDVFDFFGLARELRDLVYQGLLTGSRTILLAEDEGKHHDITVCAHRLPVTDLLLISRQFRKEYASAAKGAIELVLEDYLNSAEDHAEPTLATELLSASAIHMNLYTPCADAIDPNDEHSCSDLINEMARHRDRTKHLVAQMPQLRRVTISLHLEPNRHVAACKQTMTDEHKRLTSIDHVACLELYYCDFAEQSSEDYDYRNVRGPVMRWTAESGVLEDLGVEPELFGSEDEAEAGEDAAEGAADKDSANEGQSGAVGESRSDG
ncbi:hypothetical protein LTR36_003304 [Oleoguttula mirabilis]|uniref:Uncharacterized protein n=1 Tax=Oleoguttula mirabilis TaxID=1507867 RepID=A0AAV9JX53_9PEZI|nr:hypothetical protein LTR36_003304 [Oleoguttula mirabilis]